MKTVGETTAHSTAQAYQFLSKVIGIRLEDSGSLDLLCLLGLFQVLCKALLNLKLSYRNLTKCYCKM